MQLPEAPAHQEMQQNRWLNLSTVMAVEKSNKSTADSLTSVRENVCNTQKIVKSLGLFLHLEHKTYVV